MKPIGLVLASLIASACNSGDGPEYDIPARLQVFQADMEIDPDGTPVVLAQVGMYYGTAAPVSESNPVFVSRNVQCIAYTPGTAGWVPHSFRNLQANPGSSILLPNANGEVQALVENFHRITLYAHTGTGWEAKTTSPDVNGEFGRFGSGYFGIGQVVLAGDSGWEMPDESVTGNPPHPQLGIRRNDGTLIVLDTVFTGFGGLTAPGKEFNYLIFSSRPQFGDSALNQEILCYRWNLDRLHPDPRKQVLQLGPRPTSNALFSAQVLGETRIYYSLAQDSLAEFGFRNDTLSLLGYRVLKASEDTAAPNPYKQYLGGGISLDPLGCIHSIEAGATSPSTFPYADTLPVLVHASSCEATIDTIPLPHPTTGAFQPPSFNLRFAPDGSPMLSLILSGKISDENSWRQESIAPSWLYFARRDAAKKWTWELIAQY